MVIGFVSALLMMVSESPPAYNVHAAIAEPLSSLKVESARGVGFHDSILLWLANDAQPSTTNAREAVVTRVLEDGTIQLQLLSSISGVTTSYKKMSIPKSQLAKIRFYSPSTFPPCLRTTPVGKLQQLLPPKTRIQISDEDGADGGNGLIVTRIADGVSVNSRMVELGYAKTKGAADASMAKLQQNAEAEGRGVFQCCKEDFQAKFDDYLVSSKSRRTDNNIVERPSNPGDRVGCSDFDFYEDALRYYELYAPWYGDVARLDRNNDGIPCPGLPHTPNQVLYRLKQPSIRSNESQESR